MSREQFDGEDSVVKTEAGRVGDKTVETEMNGHLACGSAAGLELVQKVVPIVPGVVGAEADTLDLGQQRQLGPLSEAKLH